MRDDRRGGDRGGERRRDRSRSPQRDRGDKDRYVLGIVDSLNDCGFL